MALRKASSAGEVGWIAADQNLAARAIILRFQPALSLALVFGENVVEDRKSGVRATHLGFMPGERVIGRPQAHAELLTSKPVEAFAKSRNPVARAPLAAGAGQEGRDAGIARSRHAPTHIVHTSPIKRSSDFIAHLEQLDSLFGPQPGRQVKPVVLVEDNGPIHTSKRSLAALAARARWLTVEWLPKYAPELNEIEPVWRDLKAHHLAHQTFTDVNALDQAIHDADIDLNRERIPDPLAMPRTCLAELGKTEPCSAKPGQPA